jgi:ketosteroid isomerase-like protein
VDGAHFWDAVAEDAIFEFRYNIPGFTNRIEGRKAYMDWFGGYSNILHSADNLRVHRSIEAGVIILEYEVHGMVLHTGKAYDNRFCSIVTVKDRKIVHWRDYMDSLAVMSSVTPD